MNSNIYQQVKKAKRIVIKVGSSSLTTQGGSIDIARLNDLVDQIAKKKKTDADIVLVSSGAIAAALAPLGLKSRPKDLIMQQAAASVGQGLLVHRYTERFASHEIVAGQILLTSEDISRRSHYRNAIRTFNQLFELSVIPIVNENDTVATEEIRFGDNDRLAALVANLVQADVLLLLSDVEGLFDQAPDQVGAKLISEVNNFDEISHVKVGTNSSSKLGSGGMLTKLTAAKIATSAGITVVLTDAKNLARALAGEEVGTIFHPAAIRQSARELWLAHASVVMGSLVIDAGAERALLENRASLLAAGIKSSSGDFAVGDVVSVINDKNEVIARGLINFDSSELPQILGKTSKKIIEQLGENSVREVIHRDDLVLIAERQ
jgi:glutamate 5-kinase